MNQSPPVGPDQVGRTSQIVVGALISGVVMFGALAVGIGWGNPPELGLFARLGAGFAGAMIVLAFVVPSMIVAANVKQLDEQPPENWRTALAPIYQTKTLVANALLESAGFFNGIAYLLHAHWVSLAVMGVLIGLMAVTFPSQPKFETWAAQVQREHER